MKLILGGTPNSDYRLLTPLLEALDVEIIDVGTPEHWEKNPANPLDVEEDVLTLLCHGRPEHAVARDMSSGSAPSEALGRWGVAAEQIIRAFRRRREKTVVVDVALVARHPRPFINACADQFGLTKPDQLLPEASKKNNATVDDLPLLIATQTVAQDARVSDLLGALEAASIPLGVPEEAPQMDSDRLWFSLNGALDNGEENELLLLQLRQVQEELESYYLEYKEAKKRADQLEKRADQHKKRADQHKKRIDQIRVSTSWRFTRPLRVLMRLVTGKALKGRRKTSPKVKAAPPPGN